MIVFGTPKNTEAGHAVALTLLGLSIAILAGVVVLYVIGKEQSAPIPVSQQDVQDDLTKEEVVDPRAGWNHYENTTYNFAFEYPEGWMVATGTILGVPVVTTYDARQMMEASSTFGVHDADTRMSVYPHGVPLEGFGEREESSTVIVAVPGASSKDLVLGTSKRPWATITRFDSAPDSWTTAGFVFARTHITEETVKYMRDEKEVSAEEYDLYAGDMTVRHGFVDTTTRTTQEEMMHSFRFVVQESVDESQAAVRTEDDIRVTTPQADAYVTSPLAIVGEARGTWFFEGSFPVALVDAQGTRLAEVPATAQGEWMTEEFVPFEVSLAFASTTATSGVLVFSRANPADMPAHDAQLRIPVFFVQ